MVGLHYAIPFAGKWLFDLRGEIGGFGVGSDLSWQLMTVVGRQNSETFGWYFGYRAIGYDYESGQGQQLPALRPDAARSRYRHRLLVLAPE